MRKLERHSKKIKIFCILLMLICYGITSAQKKPIGKEGIPTIVNFFEQKPIVAIGETHGHVQLYQFLTELVQIEGFYKNVNDILIESGNALYQDTLDKYISGGDVPYIDIQKIWLNTTQSPVDAWNTDIYIKLLKAIRELNLRISKNDRIRVVAADSPIEWKNVRTNEDYLKERGNREEFYASTVINEVLSKNRKALLINGGAHFGNHRPTTVNQRIEKEFPNTVTVVLASSGLWRGNEDKEEQLNWSPGTITKVKDTWIGLLPGPRRITMSASSTTSTSTTTPVIPDVGPPSKFKRQNYFDYLLYLGPSKDMTYGNIDNSIYQSEKLWKEFNRRSIIRFNHNLIKDSRKTGELRPEAYN